MFNFAVSNRTKNSNKDGWRGEYETLKATQAEYQNTYQIMTPYERMTVETFIRQSIQNSYSAIATGALGDFNQVIEKLRGAQQKKLTAFRNEVNSWPVVELNDQMTLFQKRYELVLSSSGDGVFDRSLTPDQAIKKIYEEARASGNRVAQRAAAETVMSLLPKVKDQAQRMNLNTVIGQAERDLVNLHITEEMRLAAEDEKQVIDEYSASAKELQEIAKSLGDDTGVFGNGAFDTALRRVKFNPETGDYNIFEPTDSEVTRVFEKTVSGFAE